MESEQDFRAAVAAYLKNIGLNDAASVVEQIQYKTDSDLEILYKLSILAGGKLLLANRVRLDSNLDNIVLLPVSACMRARSCDSERALRLYPIDIQYDNKCTSSRLIPLNSYNLYFNFLSGSRTYHSYAKSPFPSGNKLQQIPRGSPLAYGWQTFEYPHLDYVLQKSGSTRRQVMTSPLIDRTIEEQKLYNTKGMKLFVEIKRWLLNILQENQGKNIKKIPESVLFEGITKYGRFFSGDLNQIIFKFDDFIMTLQEMKLNQLQDFQTEAMQLLEEARLWIEADDELNSTSVLTSVSAQTKQKEDNKLVSQLQQQEIKAPIEVKKAVKLEEKPVFVDIMQNSLQNGNETEEDKSQEPEPDGSDLEAAIINQLQNLEEYFPGLTPEERRVYQQRLLERLRGLNPAPDDLKLEPTSSSKSHVDNDVRTYDLIEEDLLEDMPQKVYPQGSRGAAQKFEMEDGQVEDEPLDQIQKQSISDLMNSAGELGDMNDIALIEERIRNLEKMAEVDFQPEQPEAGDKQAAENAPTFMEDTEIVIKVVGGQLGIRVPKIPLFRYLNAANWKKEMRLPVKNKAEMDAALSDINEKIEKLRSGKFLEDMYDGFNTATVSAIVPQSAQNGQAKRINVPYIQEQGIRTGGLELLGYEDDGGENINIVPGEIIAGRYQIKEQVGEAAFSNCFEVFDLETKRNVCFKVIKPEKEFLDQAFDEIRILQLIRDLDPSGKYNLVEILDYFYMRERLVIVFPLLGKDLYNYQNARLEQGLANDYTIPVIKKIAKQLLQALNLIHALYLIHLDIKPENIVFVKDLETVKLIDLGSSSFIFDKVHQYIQSRSYRAPEIMLGLPYDQTADIWSVGCVFGEFLTQKVLFPNHSVGTMLSRMASFFGPLQRDFIVSGRAAFKTITAGLCSFEINDNGQKIAIAPENQLFEFWLFGNVSNLDDDQILFSDFLRQCCEVDNTKRPTAAQLECHFWFNQ